MIDVNTILQNREYILALERKRFLYYEPHEKQRLFHSLDSRERLFLAGNRCGKTYCGSVEGAMHLTGIYPQWWEGFRFNEPISMWAVSDTAESTRDILQYAYLGNPETGAEGTVHRSLIINETARRGISGAIDTVTIRHSSGGVSTLGFKSYDQGRKKFQGTHKHVIHLDEEPPEDIYTECLMRTTAVGDKEPGLMIITMTPLSGVTNLIKNFLMPENGTALDGVIQESGRVFVQAGWEDNPYLDEEERQHLLKTTPPHELEARQKGIPSLGSGLVYPISESKIVVEPFDIPEHWARVYGMDFGWSNPTAVVFGAHDRDNDIVYLYGEYVQSERTPQSHCVSLMEMGANWIPGVCDPAGQMGNQQDGVSLIELYTRHGLNLTKADNTVESGLQEVLERMQEGRLKVFSNLTGWLSEFRMYSRDDKGRIKKQNDHLMDATRYLVVSGLGLAKVKDKGFRRRKRSALTI